MNVERIDSPADPRLADYRDLKDAELRLRRGVFVVEGREGVRRLLVAGRYRTRSVLVTPPGLAGVQDLLETASGIRVMLVPPGLVRDIVGYGFHRGCLAVGERAVEPGPEALMAPPGPRRLLLLEDLVNPDNVGGVFRNAQAFGADAALLSPACADPLYRKAIRVSAGASLCIPFARVADWPAGLGALHGAGYTIIALTPAAAAVDIAEFGRSRRVPERVALLLGTEGGGLSAAALRMADCAARIAMAAGADSLNVATASGVALHHLRSVG